MTGERDWAAHVGGRVVVRIRRPEGGFRDVLGDLLAVGEDVLRVRTRTGEVDVLRADVVAGKPVPPPPVRRAPAHRALSAAGLETVLADHWRAPERAWLSGVAGGWLLRAGGGFTGRANSALVLGDPGRPAAQALAEVRRWYGDRGLPARVALAAPPPGSPDEPGAAELRAAATALAEAGWEAGGRTEVLTAAPGDLRDPGARPPAGLHVELLDRPDAGWLDRYRPGARPLPPVAATLLTSAPEQVFVAVRDDAGRTIAIARGALAMGWASLGAVEVIPERRRRGLGRLLLATVAGWAWHRRARALALQVEEDEEPARRLYLSAGFTAHHTYAYLSPVTSEHS